MPNYVIVSAYHRHRAGPNWSSIQRCIVRHDASSNHTCTSRPGYSHAVVDSSSAKAACAIYYARCRCRCCLPLRWVCYWLLACDARRRNVITGHDRDDAVTSQQGRPADDVTTNIQRFLATYSSRHDDPISLPVAL